MAPPPEPPTTITLRVKVPPGHVTGSADEFTLGSDIAVASKIGQIRELIQEALPSSPTPERQRLLYGGRALVDNDQTVADALNIRRDPTQTEYVIHLLVKGEGANVPPVPHRTGMRTPGRAESPAAAARPATVPPPLSAQQPAPHAAANQIPHVQQMHQNAHQNVHQAAHQQAMHHHMQQQWQQQQANLLAQAQRLQAQLLHNQPGAFPPAMMPFQMQPFAGQMPGMPFQQQAGLPMQPPLGQGQPRPAPANGAQAPNSADQPPAAQAQGGQAPNQTNDGQTSIQFPPRVTTHQTAQGHDVQVRIQQTLRFPNAGLQLPQRPVGSPGFPPNFQAQGTPSLQGNPNAPSALDRARENVAEMQRLLAELRSAQTTTESQQAQIQSLEERTRNLNDYIDPFRAAGFGNNRARSNSPASNVGAALPTRMTPLNALDARPEWQQRAHEIRQAQHQASTTNSSDVTCYLLSSPGGPHAIVYSPQHGTYTGQMPSGGINTVSASLQPTPTVAPGAAENTPNQQNQAIAQIVGDAAQQAQAPAQAPQQDPLGPLGPIMGHFWLLLRVLIFSYFLLGTNMGWRRPLALVAIGAGFWMIRMGVLGDGGALRRWWDGIMNDERAPAAQQPGQQDQNQQQGDQEGQPPAGNARPGQMPTPEQLAQRLLDEDARARDQARDQRLQWVRERLRPIERAVALLVASLWPGVGEAYVRAREQEERRRAEEEIAARRREEEERQKEEEEEKQKNEGGGSSDEKSTAQTETEARTATAGSTETGQETRTSNEIGGDAS